MAHFGARHFGIFTVTGGAGDFLPYPQQDAMTQALELPLPDTLTKIVGIHQSDIIVRSALVAAFADLRANPWLLDYVFASLPQDTLTWKEYGENSVQQAKQWFLRTNIPVKIVPVLNELSVPSVTISLVSSSEVTQEATIGDVHSEAYEQTSTPWPALTSIFTPTTYNQSTGIMAIPTLPEDIYAAPGMYLVDKTGRLHEILEVIDSTTLKIQPGTAADFSETVLKSSRPGYVTSIESSSFRESYRIGVHVGGEPAQLVWLHSIVQFILMRYKEALLEARGFERSTHTSSDFQRDAQFETELVFSRYIELTGYVRQYWPKAVASPIDAVVMDPIRVSGENASVRVADAGVDPDEALWVGDLDTINPARRK